MFDLIFDFALLAAVYALIYKLRLKKRDGRYRVWFTLFYLYVCMVICVTLMPFQLVLPGANGNALEEINLEPFRDLKRGYLGAQSGIVPLLLGSGCRKARSRRHRPHHEHRRRSHRIYTFPALPPHPAQAGRGHPQIDRSPGRFDTARGFLGTFPAPGASQAHHVPERRQP